MMVVSKIAVIVALCMLFLSLFSSGQDRNVGVLGPPANNSATPAEPGYAQSGAKEKAACADFPLYSSYGSELSAIKSPDGKKLLTVRAGGSHLSYIVRTDSGYFTARMRGFRAEVLWSLDSRSFAVNQTEGG